MALSQPPGVDPNDDSLALKNALRGKFFYLLVLIALLLALYPYLGNGPAGRLFLNALNLAVLIMATFATRRSRLQVTASVVLAALALSAQCVFIATGELTAMRTATAASMLFYAYSVVNILWYVLRGVEVTADKIHGAICAYLIFALIWMMAYALVESLAPGSFYMGMGHNPDQKVKFNELLYFSIVTLTTTGYGDIVPLSTYARSLANLEQLVGVFYVAILIARLAGLYPPRGTTRKEIA